MQADVLTSAPPGKPLNQRRKGSQVERRGRKRKVGAKGVALLMSPAIYRYPGIMGLVPGLQRKKDWNSALPEIRPEPEFEFSAKRR